MALLDMIGPVMIGPSSSHTAGACRLGLVARELLGEEPVRVRIILHGSFAKTGRGHGTDRAIVAGVLGFRPDDVRLPSALEIAKKADLLIDWQVADLGEVHPNSAKIELYGKNQKVSLLGSSTGGGAIECVEVDGLRLRFTGSQSTLLVMHKDAFGSVARVSKIVADDKINIAALTCNRETRGGRALMCLELDQPVSNQAIEKISQLDEVIWTRMIAPVMETL